jgi:cobalt-zinc-cadmium efflux system outer membrane protein
MKQIVASLSTIALIVMASCARKPGDAGFADVQKSLADRGGYLLRWNTGSAADESVAKSVRALLSRELTVDDAVQVALLNNPRLQATYEDLGVAQADLVQAGLLRNPVFDAEIKFSESGGGTQLELAVVQEFLDIFQIPLRKKLAARAAELAKLRVTGAVLDLAGEARQAFYAHQATTQTLKLRRSVVEATNASFDFARRLREAGNITELRLAREQAMHEQAKLDLASAEAEVLQTRERLNVLMGLWGSDTQWNAVARLGDVTPEELDVASIESRAIERSIDLASARTELDGAAGTLGITRTFALGGDIEVGAAAEREPEGGWTVGPAFSVPIPLFDTGSAKVSRATAELRRARQNYAATAIEIRSSARSARNQLLAARERAERYRTVILPLKHSITEQTQAEFNAMLVGTFDVLQAKQSEIEAGADYVTALRDYWLARADLEQVANGRVRGVAQD